MREVRCCERERFETRVRVRFGYLEKIIDSFWDMRMIQRVIFQGMKKIEMFKRADGRLRGNKRDSTSLANR